MNVSRDPRPLTARENADAADTALLAAGILAVAIYGVGDLASGLLYTGYSFRTRRSANSAPSAHPCGR
ncbi:hypothetical protein [Arthrobacter sp. AL12]|uniref:hypothetical protein n=1 Tax=Arthrobacter sp. AL12 TaxID=3042241 RepID=UPI002499F48D|nr:hypothetical protein [Arthrobacter sp. AL12]MDI3213051.1 hypothetical protein [Arthrobacter sp. AL12]